MNASTPDITWTAEGQGHAASFEESRAYQGATPAVYLDGPDRYERWVWAAITHWPSKTLLRYQAGRQCWYGGFDSERDKAWVELERFAPTPEGRQAAEDWYRQRAEGGAAC